MSVDWKDFKNYFIGNPSAHAIQRKDGKGWVAKREKLYKSHITKHLNHDITLGSYNVFERNNRVCCKWICIDIDLHTFKLENGKKITNSSQLEELEYPIRLYRNRKSDKKTHFFTKEELKEYYWDRTGLIVYEKLDAKPTKKSRLTKTFFIDSVKYWYKEKYRIEADEKDKLRKLVYDIEWFLIKFYNIPRQAICREKSGRGFHIWIKLKDLTTLKRAYDFKLDIEKKVLSFFGIKLDEIFPKQEDIDHTYKCPYCKKNQKISAYERAKYQDCQYCGEEFELSENLYEEGLGNFVKLPLSLNRKTNTKCVILDKKFELSKQKGFEISDMIKRIRKKERLAKRYDNTNSQLDLSKWKPIDNLDGKHFYSKLRYCMKQIVKGRPVDKTPNAHAVRRCLANELFKLKAPLDVRINAFRRQPDFDEQKTKYQVQDLEMRCRRDNRFYVSQCSTIQEWGYCYETCPQHYRATGISEEDINEMLFREENFGINGGWDEVRKLLNEKINGNRETREYIVKTTRSGTTTNVILETIESDKKLLMIAPTIKICEITVEEALELTEKEVSLFRLGSNKDLCIQLLDRVKNVKALGRFPFLLKENCRECQYNEKESCPFHEEYTDECKSCREFNRLREKCNWKRAVEDIQDYDIIYITIAKMYALMKTTDPEAEKIIDKIFNNVDVVFLDEISNVLDVGSESITFKEEADPIYRELAGERNFKSRFDDEFEMLTEFMEARLNEYEKNIWYSLNDFVRVVDRLHNRWSQLHYNNSFQRINSPLYRVIEENTQKHNEDEEDSDKSGDGDWLSVYQTIVDYAEETDFYPRSIVSLMVLAKFPQFYLQYTNPLKYNYRLEILPAKPIREFLDFLNQVSEQKQFFTTDATEPPIDVSRMFPNIDELIINDPMNTARKQRVIPDNQSINISKIKALRFYLEDIKKYIQKNGNGNTMIICQNIITSSVLRKVLKKGKDYKHLTYFRSPLTIGTPSKCRTIITIGSPYPPKDSHRWLADLFMKEELVDIEEYDIDSLTRHLEYYNAKSNFFQAISRGKDPKGEIASNVYCYGLNKFQIVHLLDFPIAVPKVKTNE